MSAQAAGTSSVVKTGVAPEDMKAAVEAAAAAGGSAATADGGGGTGMEEGKEKSGEDDAEDGEDDSPPRKFWAVIHRRVTHKLRSHDLLRSLAVEQANGVWFVCCMLVSVSSAPRWHVPDRALVVFCL